MELRQLDQPAVLRRVRERHPGPAVRHHRGTSALPEGQISPAAPALIDLIGVRG